MQKDSKKRVIVLSFLSLFYLVSPLLADDYAYVSDERKNAVYVMNITKPDAPFIATRVTGFNMPEQIAIQGNYAYVADLGSGSLTCLDISSPTQPVVTHTEPLSNEGSWGVAISGNYAFVTGLSGALSVVDLSNPASPSFALNLPVGTATTAIAISGNYAFVSDYEESRLYVIDIQTPTSPTVIGSYAGNEAVQSAINGSHLFLPNTAPGSEVLNYDISDPTALPTPTSIAIGPDTGPEGIATKNNMLYVTTSYYSDNNPSEIVPIDNSDPGNPALRTPLTGLPRYPHGVAISGNFAFIANETNFTVVDISTPSVPSLVFTQPCFTYARFIAIPGASPQHFTGKQEKEVDGADTPKKEEWTLQKLLGSFRRD